MSDRPEDYGYEFVRLAPHRHDRVDVWVVFPRQGKVVHLLAAVPEPVGFVATWFTAMRDAQARFGEAFNAPDRS